MRVLVSGAGIAGPALALCLRRYGVEVTVVDSAERPRPGGQAVDIRGTARAVIDRMGLGAAIRSARLDERGLAMVDDRGRRRVEMPAEMFGGEGIVAELEILRGDLAEILLEATRAEVEYRFGDRIAELAQNGEGVDVGFAGGRRERYDAVVGADGVHSGVRALAFGPDTDFVRHLGAYTAYFSLPAPADLDAWFLMYNAPGGRVAGLRPDRSGTAKAYLSFTSPPLSDRELRDPRQVLGERMAGAGWRVPELLAALPLARDLVFGAIEQVRVAQWSRRRVVLLGDAGYCGSPLAGHGTSLALVGAYVLAGELGRRPTDPPAAFRAYQRAMQAYVDCVHHTAAGRRRRVRPAEPADDPAAAGVDALDAPPADAVDPRAGVPQGRRHGAARLRAAAGGRVTRGADELQGRRGCLLPGESALQPRAPGGRGRRGERQRLPQRPCTGSSLRPRPRRALERVPARRRGSRQAP